MVIQFLLQRAKIAKAELTGEHIEHLLTNIVTGITHGFTRQLEINGVGYKAAAKGKILELSLGFSHLINYELPAGVEASVDKKRYYYQR